MKILDYVLLAILLLWLIFAVRHTWEKRKSGTCSGCCTGCASPCKNRDEQRK